MTYARQFMLLGAIFGLVAPAGVLLYGLIQGGLPNPIVIFLILVVGGVAVLGAAGWMIGRREDALANKNAELRELSSRLRRQTLTDALTEVANRRLFDYELEREVARSRRYNQPLALVMLDLDRFKDLNDKHGHQAGDEVLRALGMLLQDERRQGDTVSRYGGEEFAAILPHARAEDARHWAERVRGRLAAEPIQTNRGPQPVTASFGVAALDPATQTAAELVAAADEALYQAKQRGRNRVVVHRHDR